MISVVAVVCALTDNVAISRINGCAAALKSNTVAIWRIVTGAVILSASSATAVMVITPAALMSKANLPSSKNAPKTPSAATSEY